MTMTRIRIKSLYTGKRQIEDALVVIKNSRFTEVREFQPEDRADASYPELTAIPGFIDNHIHGGYGHDVMSADYDGLANFSAKLATEGTTAYLSTFCAAPEENLNESIDRNTAFIKEGVNHGAEMIGIHMEGPYLNENQTGMMPPGSMYNPDLEQLKGWVERSENTIKLMTIAPELPGALKVIEWMEDNGIVSSAGHTSATYAEMEDAMEVGMRRVTHLCNAMCSMHHREPGVLGACLDKPELMAEMAGFDTYSILPAVWRIIFRQKGAEGMVITTDSGELKGLPDGFYTSLGRDIEIRNGRIYTAYQGGDMHPGVPMRFVDCVKNLLRHTPATLADAVQMSSVNPAKELGIDDRKGYIEPGFDADLLIVDDELEIRQVFCRGRDMLL